MLAGRGGEAAALAMRVVVALARLSGAAELLDITGAHRRVRCSMATPAWTSPSCWYRGGGRVRVPTTLNLSSMDLLHRDRYRRDAHTAAARRLMGSYVAMGATATWTCARYQLPTRLGLGEHGNLRLAVRPLMVATADTPDEPSAMTPCITSSALRGG